MEPKDYQSALTELQAILSDLQNEQVPIDTLSEKAQRAKLLLEYCRQKLRQTDVQLKGLFEEKDE